MKRILYLSSLLLFQTMILSQNKVNDSFKNELSKIKKPDSLLVMMKNNLKSNVELAKKNILIAKHYLDEFPNEKDINIAKTYYYKAKSLVFLRNEKAYLDLKKALLLSKGNSDLKASIFNEMAIFKIMFDGDVDSTRHYLYKAKSVIDSDVSEKTISSVYADLAQINSWDYSNNDSVMYYCDKVFNLNLKNHNEAKCLGFVANSYRLMNQIDKAKEYKKLEFKACEKLNLKGGMAAALKGLGGFYMLKNNKDIDSTFFYLNKAKKIFYEIGDKYSIDAIERDIFSYYRVKGEYNKAFIQSKKIDFKRSHGFTELGEVLYKINKKNEAKALFEKALKEEYKPSKYDSAYYYEKLYELYKEDNKPLLALNAYEKSKVIESSLKTIEVQKNLDNLDVKYQTAQKEKEIQQLTIDNQKTELKAQKQKEFTFIVLGSLAFIVLGGLAFIYRKKQQRKVLELLHKQEVDLFKNDIRNAELQRLIGQIKPHEIKNIFSGVSVEIQEKAPEAYKSLMRLKKLTESAIYNDSLTESSLIQLKQVEDYLLLKQEDLFETLSFSTKNNLKKEIQLPMLLLMNLVRNAVQYGIKGNGGGSIDVNLLEKSDKIYIEVNDTGKGFEIEEGKQKGIGILAYQKMFTNFNSVNKEKAVFKINSKKGEGTNISITIPKGYKFN